jgi:surface protein
VYNPFISVWSTNLNTTITLPLIDSADDPTSEYNFYVDWGDGNVSLITEWNSVNATHDYGTNDNYTIKMYGLIKGINFAFSSINNSNSTLEIQQWGDINLGNYGSYFIGCGNLKITATDILNLTGTTNLEGMFSNTGIDTVPNMNLWNVSSVTNMAGMFENSRFNQSINSWDVSNVNNMSEMFVNSWFDQPLNNWNVSNVTDMSGMFAASPFNQPINNWDVSSVNNMELMFAFSIFNQSINDWNVSNVNNTIGMFAFAESFNQPLDNWDVSKVTDMELMFLLTSFNQPINSWNVSSVTNMAGMFIWSDFNQPINDWDVSNVENMNSMFGMATSFNQPLDKWDVSKVTDMTEMFYGAESFNQPLGMWNISSVTDMNDIFNGVPFSRTNYDNLLIGWENQTPNIPSDVILGNINSYYCAGEDARNELETNYNWTFDDLGKYCGTLPIPTPTNEGSSKSRTEPTFNYEWNCETGLLEIESEEDLEIRLMSLVDFSTYKSTTNNNGKVVFNLARDGNYRVFTGSTSEFYPLQKDINLEFCEVEENETDDEDGSEIIIPEDNETVEEEINITKIEKLIEQVEEELEKAINENKEIGAAQQKLNEARDAFNRGEYELAEKLANEALILVLNAEAQQPVIDDKPIEGNVTEPEQEDKEEIRGFDWLPYIIATIVLLILIWLGFKYMRKQENN